MATSGAWAQEGSGLLERPARLDVRGASLNDALRELQRRSGVALAFSPDHLTGRDPVSCACLDATVAQALDTLLAGTGLRYLVTGNRLVISTGNGLVTQRPPDAAIRTGRRVCTVLGKVSESTAGRPIGGALVQVLGRRLRTVTDVDGNFSFEAVPLGTYTLRVSRIGFEPKELELVAADTSEQRIDITLVPLAVRLADIVVAPGRFGVMETEVPSRQTLTREEMETMPQLGEDVFRGMRRIPGVATDDISTRLYPRGGTDQELLVTMDGLELYEPYHLKDWDGVLGLIDVNSIGGIELTTGGFSVEHGDKLAGVLDMKSRPTPATGSRTALGLSITNASIMSQGRFDGGNGQWLFAARRGYMDIVFSLVGENEFSPKYSDVYGKVQHLVHRNHNVSVNVLHGSDNLKVDQDEGYLGSGWRSSYGWVTWDATPLEGVAARTMTWAGRVTRRRVGSIDVWSYGDLVRTTVDDDRVFSFAGVRHDLEIELSDRMMFKLGGEVKRVDADYAYYRADWSRTATTGGEPAGRVETVSVEVNPDGHEASAYLATRFQPVDAVTAEVGVRYDRISHTDDGDFAPRVLAAFQPTPRTTVRASWGRYFQSHGIHELQVADGQRDFYSSDKAETIALGIEHELGDDVTVRMEAYRRSIADQHPRYVNAMWSVEAFNEAEGDRLFIDPERGSARGIEFSVARPLGRHWAWSANYVLSVAEDEIDGKWVPRRTDQRHAIGVDAVYRPNDRWLLSWAWTLHSGWPSTATTFAFETLADGSYQWQRTYDEYHGIRLPTYHRLDIRLTRTFQIGGGALQAYLDVFNIYGRDNVRSYSYWASLYADGRMVVGRNPGQELMPMLPSIGVRYEF